MTTRGSRPATGVTTFSPEAMRQASARWHTIWCADIRPQRAGVSGPIVRRRCRISALHSARANVFITRSRAHEALATGGMERGERTCATGFGLFHERSELALLTQFVKLRPRGERGAREVPLYDCAAEIVHAVLVVTDIAQQPSLLEDRLWIVV